MSTFSEVMDQIADASLGDDADSIRYPCPKHGARYALLRAEPDGQLSLSCDLGCPEAELAQALAAQSSAFRDQHKPSGVDNRGEPSRTNDGDHYKERTAAAQQSGNGDVRAAQDQQSQLPSSSTHEQSPDRIHHHADASPKNYHEFTIGEDDPPPKPLDRNPYIPLESTVIDSAFTRVPPQNIEAEMGILAGILMEPHLLPDIAKVIHASDFYRESHREIYKAMCRCAEKDTLRFQREPGDEMPDGGVDLISLTHELRAMGVLDTVGGQAYLGELVASVIGTYNVPRWCEIVREAAIKRDVIRGLVEVTSNAYNGSTLPALAGELQQISSTDALRTALPLTLISGKIEIMTGKAFAAQQAAVKRDWIAEALLARREISLWSGKVEAGKTTLMRTLVMCVLRGEPFLGRWISPSSVLYVMLDGDGPALTYEEFLTMGWIPESDPINFLVDPVMAVRPNSFEQFHAKLLALRPGLVVIDPLGRFQKIDEKEGGFNGYGMTYAMAKFSELARQADCHIALLHHIPRGRNDDDDPATAAFGSVAISGGCNARFVCLHKPGDIYTVMSSKGKGGGFRPFDGEVRVKRDETTHWVAIEGPYSWKEQADAIKPKVLEVIEASDDDMGAMQIAQAVGVPRSIAGAAAKSLFKEGKVEMKITKANKHLFCRKSPQGELVDS